MRTLLTFILLLAVGTAGAAEQRFVPYNPATGATLGGIVYTNGTFTGNGSGLTNLDAPAALPKFYASKSRSQFLLNAYEDANVDWPTGDTRGVIISADHSSLLGGRFNQGLNTGTAGTFSELNYIQYGMSWGWNALALGTTNTSPADAVKGSVNIGYNNFVGKTYDAAFGYNNAVVGSAGFAAGSENIVGSTASSTNTPIVSHLTNVLSIVLRGNVTNTFTTGAYLLVSQSDGVSAPELQVRTITSTSSDNTNTTVGINTNLSSLVNANSNGWAMVVGTSGAGNGGAAVGHQNRVFGPYGFAAGLSNIITQAGGAIGWRNTISGDHGFALGSYNTLPNATGIALGVGNVAGAFNNATLIGMSNSVTRTRGTTFGVGAVANSYGEWVFANGWKAAAGDSQLKLTIQRKSIAFINTNWFTLNNDAVTEGMNLQNTGIYGITARVIGQNSAHTKLFDYELKGFVKRISGTATELYPASVTTLYSSVGTIELSLDTSVGTALYLRVRDTAAGGDTIYWVAKLEAVELVY